MEWWLFTSAVLSGVFIGFAWRAIRHAEASTTHAAQTLRALQIERQRLNIEVEMLVGVLEQMDHPTQEQMAELLQMLNRDWSNT